MSESASFIWNELITDDQRASGEFYSKLFGWAQKEVETGFGLYTIFQQNGKDVAGIMNPTIEYTRKLGSRWYGYVSVDNIDACVTRAKDLGASLIAGPDEVPGVGRVGLIADPTGALIRLMQPMAENSRK